jgi:hypothetical protein
MKKSRWPDIEMLQHIEKAPDNLNIFVSGDVSGYNLGAVYLLGGHSIKPVR